jgi:hypothetical protein
MVLLRTRCASGRLAAGGEIVHRQLASMATQLRVRLIALGTLGRLQLRRAFEFRRSVQVTRLDRYLQGQTISCKNRPPDGLLSHSARDYPTFKWIVSGRERRGRVIGNADGTFTGRIGTVEAHGQSEKR